MAQIAAGSEFVSVRQAASIAGVDASTVWKWIKAGTLRRYRTPGKRTRVRRADLFRPEGK